jgi:copper chaperone NosL
MRRGPRLVLGAGAVLLGAAFVTPLWHIGLLAPQYPEGLGLYIWVSRITGEKPQDLDSINGLNHYIGMKRIIPESIPELRFMPVVLGALIATGLVVAVWGNRRALYAWTALFAAGALAGLADFWKWGYEYGHELDPHAAIKIPGMSYQPPILGGKQLLNFHAASWPAPGGWIAIGVLMVAVVLSVREWRRSRPAAG